MVILFIIGLLLGGVSVIFALQNTVIITVNFFSWQLTGSLALILLLAISSGIVVALLLLLPEFLSSYFRYKNLKKDKEQLEEDLRKQKELTVFAKQTSPTGEEIAKIENGAIEKNPL